MCVPIQCTCVCVAMHVCMCVCIQERYTCVCVVMHVCMYVCIQVGYTCVCVYWGIPVCRCACMYMFMCVCVFFLRAHLIVGYADKCSPVPGPRRVYYDDGYSGAFVLVEEQGRGRVSGSAFLSSQDTGEF